jgi:hypothetical protein
MQSVWKAFVGQAFERPEEDPLVRLPCAGQLPKTARKPAGIGAKLPS